MTRTCTETSSSRTAVTNAWQITRGDTGVSSSASCAAEQRREAAMQVVQRLRDGLLGALRHARQREVFLELGFLDQRELLLALGELRPVASVAASLRPAE